MFSTYLSKYSTWGAKSLDLGPPSVLLLGLQYSE